MADERLVDFYEKAGGALEPINQWRLIRTQQRWDEGKAAKQFREAMSAWGAEIEAARKHVAEEDEWRITLGIWKHAGRVGPAPPEPEWPNEIPEYFEAIQIVHGFNHLLGFVEEWYLVEAIDLQSELERIILNLDHLERVIEAPQDDPADGLIDRNQLAALLNLTPKTLANRADELPEPTARNAKSVPMFLYQDARRSLVKMYPEKEFMLPKTFAEISVQ